MGVEECRNGIKFTSAPVMAVILLERGRGPSLPLSPSSLLL